METENTVSIWIGNFDTKLELDEFITLKYNDEGEVIPSMFYHQYNIDIDVIDDSNVPRTNNTEFVATVRYK